ncbi:MAG: hypothetical protein PHX72_03405 [Candidatus Shapirobacteria bacterium]|nr:hypothetical protein [Candidatus Shapirobacteria bacterium]
MPEKKGEISLLPKEEDKLVDQVSNWVLETGRWIVVLTLFFVLVAFLSRFWLDQKITNLYGQTAQKVAIIEAAEDFENQFRLLQKQIEKITALDRQKPNQAEKIKKIVRLLPRNINLTSIEIADSSVNFTVFSLSESDLNELFQNLILCPYLDQISIAGVSSKTFGLETELSIKARIID